MRRILTEFYSWMFRLTGIKPLAYIGGLVYVTAMNFIIVNGLVLLTQGLFSFASLLMILFRFPVSFATLFLFFGLTYWLTPSAQTIAKDAKKNYNHRTLLLYTMFGLVLFLYKHFGDWLFV